LATRRDVVKGSNGQYYLCILTHTPTDTTTKPVTGANYTTYWESFGATFSSVATDILLAQDATITRGLVIGTDGLTTGFIRSTGATSLTGGTAPGFYLQQDGKFRFGQNVVAGNSYINWDNTTLEIRGKLLTDAASTSEIGNWKVIDGNFQDSTDGIVLNASQKALQIFDSGGVKKVEIRQANVSDPGGSFSNVSIDIPATYDFSQLPSYNTEYIGPGSFYSNEVVYDLSGFSVTTPGTYNIATLDWGSAEYIYALASNDFDGYFEIYITAQIWDTDDFSGNIIDSFTLGFSTGVINGPLEELGVSFSDGYPKSITFPTADTYYVHTTTSVYGYSNSGKVTVTGNINPQSQTFSVQLNQTEIGGDGLLVVADSNNYTKIQRTTSNPIVDIKTNGSTPGLRITNANISATAKAIEVLAGDVSLSGAGNNVIVNGGYIGTEGTTDGVRMGIEGGKSRLSGQDWPSQNDNVATARLRPGATVLGINGRELIFDSSTIRVKNNIEDYPDSAYESIKKIRPVLYTPLNIIDSSTYETGEESDYSSYPMPNPKEYIGKHGGFIAEWLDEDPEMRRYVCYGVSGSAITTESLTYDKLVVPLTKAVQILMNKVEALEAYVSASK
jgi:hypothetical protein